MTKKVKLGNKELTVEQERQATFDSNIPQEPVEKGTDISDDITNKPVSYSFTVILTPESSGNPDVQEREIRSELNRLITLRNNKAVFRLVTPEAVFERAAIQSLQYNRSAEIAYRVSITVTEIRTTEEEEADAETGVRDAGKRPSKEETEDNVRRQLGDEKRPIVFPGLSLGSKDTWNKLGEDE